MNNMIDDHYTNEEWQVFILTDECIRHDFRNEEKENFIARSEFYADLYEYYFDLQEDEAWLKHRFIARLGNMIEHEEDWSDDFYNVKVQSFKNKENCYYAT